MNIVWEFIKTFSFIKWIQITAKAQPRIEDKCVTAYVLEISAGYVVHVG
jgi:hypothetical protein